MFLISARTRGVISCEKAQHDPVLASHAGH
jgi:hypothetical protein